MYVFYHQLNHYMRFYHSLSSFMYIKLMLFRYFPRNFGLSFDYMVTIRVLFHLSVFCLRKQSSEQDHQDILKIFITLFDYSSNESNLLQTRVFDTISVLKVHSKGNCILYTSKQCMVDTKLPVRHNYRCYVIKLWILML